MIIKTISRSEFGRLLPHHPALESLMVEQVEWFSNKSGNLLGVIAKGEGVAGWNYAILKRDGKNDFHVRKVMNNFFNLNAARVDLFLSMTAIPVRISAMGDEIIRGYHDDSMQQLVGGHRFTLGELETAIVIWKGKPL
jgi:hypothetical protein